MRSENLSEKTVLPKDRTHAEIIGIIQRFREHYNNMLNEAPGREAAERYEPGKTHKEQGEIRIVAEYMNYIFVIDTILSAIDEEGIKYG